MNHRKPGVVLRYQFGGRPDARVVGGSQRILQLEYVTPWHCPGVGTVIGQTITKPEYEDWREVSRAA